MTWPEITFDSLRDQLLTLTLTMASTMVRFPRHETISLFRRIIGLVKKAYSRLTDEFAMGGTRHSSYPLRTDGLGSADSLRETPSVL